MAFVHGKGQVTKLGSFDISQYANSITLNMTADSHDVTTFGKSAHTYAGGLHDGTATIAGVFDTSASSGLWASVKGLIGTEVAMEYQPEGAGTGKAQVVVDVLVTGVEITGPVADMISYSISLQLSDAADTTDDT